MDDGSMRLLILSGPAAESDAEKLARQVRALGYTPLRAHAPGATTPLPDGPFRLMVWLQLEAPSLTRAVAEAAAHPDVPVIVIGEASAPMARVWLRSVPSPALWELLIKELAPPAAASGSQSGVQSGSAAAASTAAVRWRRKGDMIIGHSRATQELLRILDRLAPSTAPVLVTGESGTGKELVARALHFSSPRFQGPFIALNCAAIPESLVEAELFGHQRGAFTGAVSNRAGAFESAHDGTLFLDEIGEMPLHHQAKLLRVLETSEITRIGSNSSRLVNVRVVTATNRDLAAEVSAGRFREDLYYRLKVYPVHLEPLRKRPEDIPPIIDHHLALIASREHRQPFRLAPSALERVIAHGWPGNVRELINVLERACLVAQGSVIHAEDLSLPSGGAVPASTSQNLPAYRDAKAQFESDYYVRLMKVTGGNVSLASKLSQKTRKEIYDALKKLGLDAEAYRGSAESGASSTPPSPRVAQR